MPRTTFQINITGPEGPASVALSDLADVLVQFERAVTTYAQVTAAQLPEGSVTISLVDIRQGSEGLVFSVPEPVLSAVALMSRDVHQGSFVTRAAHCEVFGLWERLRSRHWGMAFVQDSFIHAAEISPSRGISPPPSPPEVTGDTTLLARCLRVGGVKPKAELRLRTGELLYPDVSEEVARELGKRLYDEVVVRATATWRTDTWEVVQIRIDSVSAFRRVDPVLAFKELAEAAKGRWDEVDAREYVESLRADANARDLK
jgi:hypothetical protein